MKITAIKTHKITQKDKDICKILDKYIRTLAENSVVAITSKIVSITEGRIVKIGSTDKDRLIQQEAEYFLPRETNKYGISFTITNNILAAAAGIDESNGGGYYVLWPKDPQKSANAVRQYLQKKFHVKNIGVIITDSKTTPLRWGVTGMAIAHSGFQALDSYIGKLDLFGRKFAFEKVNVMDSLAAAGAFVMGEGDEQTPLAIIEDLPFVKFQKRNPTSSELKSLKISIKDDLYATLLKSVKWKSGKRLQIKF